MTKKWPVGLGLILGWILLGLTGCDRSAPAPARPTPGPTPAPAAAPQPAPSPPQAAAAIEVTFTYGSEKKSWVNDVTAAFNQGGHKTQSGRPIKVNATAMGSGECIEEILSGRRETHLTSPASAAFIKLGNAESRTKTGDDLVGSTENLVLSPVVIAMWKPMAEVLGWPGKALGWSDILDLAVEPRGWAARGHAEWGPFKFGHTHPEFSNSGLISALAIVYAANSKVTGLTLDDVQKPETASFLKRIESAVQHYGSSTGFFSDKLVANGPGYLSASVLYESSIIDAYHAKTPPALPLVAIYPREGTFWSDHPVGVVKRPWVTAEHADAARIYIKYLLDRPQQEKALTYGFRPADPAIAVKEPISTANGVDPEQPKTTLEVPDAQVMHGVIQLWRQNKKAARVVLVFDTSGSMQKEQRMPNAQAGAQELITMLGDEDQLSVLAFSSEMRWIAERKRVHDERAGLKSAVGGLIAQGETRLYDSILEAHQRLDKDPQADKISAVVVLTDGADTKSRIKLAELLAGIRGNEERPTVRVFTIGYGAEAPDILKEIADSTQAKFYKGTTDNIREVFKDIATFF